MILNKKVDYLASKYAAMKDKIQNNFFGEESDKQLDKLNALYQSAVDGVSDKAKEYQEYLSSNSEFENSN